MTFPRNISQYYLLNIPSSNITRKMEVKRDVIQYFCVTLKYFRLMIRFEQIIWALIYTILY